MDKMEEENCFGIDQLDNITLGRMVPGSFGLFYGPTGCGKSSMLYHFLFQGASMDNDVCLISNEPPGRLSGHMSTFKRHQPNWLKDGYIAILNVHDLMGLIGSDLEDSGPDDVDLFLDLLLQVVQHLDAKRLVIDPVNPILYLLEEWNKVHFMQRLKGKLIEKGVTTLMALDTSISLEERSMSVLEPYLFDIIVGFRKDRETPITMNTLTVERWKGAPHANNTYVIDISREGILLVPRILSMEVK
ncbi:MAG: RAD55 family ATPase [Thermoplasmatota archaeon]